MFILKQELFNKLPEEARGMIRAEATSVEDEDTQEAIERLAGEKGSDDTDIGEALKYGPENEFEDKVTEDGGLVTLPESKKNSIKSFEEAADRGNSLIEAMSKRERSRNMNKVGKIPQKGEKEKIELGEGGEREI